ncbi:unnamed protein product [marine sediment metagenome]|uniref:Uncharacterized protein n=1 Tax=marine sediment metagenome TaxID=412755 RepID=X1FVM6_9ZZZZ
MVAGGLGIVNIGIAERVEIICTDKDTHFTEALTQYEIEKEALAGLISNRIHIRGVNIISTQPLMFFLVFFKDSHYDDADININSFGDSVELDMTSLPTFRIENTGPYYLNVGDLEIIYECLDEDYTVRCGLLNISGAPKNAGATGVVQVDIKYSPRL